MNAITIGGGYARDARDQHDPLADIDSAEALTVAFLDGRLELLANPEDGRQASLPVPVTGLQTIFGMTGSAISIPLRNGARFILTIDQVETALEDDRA